METHISSNPPRPPGRKGVSADPPLTISLSDSEVRDDRLQAPIQVIEAEETGESKRSISRAVLSVGKVKIKPWIRLEDLTLEAEHQTLKHFAWIGACLTILGWITLLIILILL